MTTKTETTEEKPKATRKPAAKKTATFPEALAAFQADLPQVKLDGKNPHFKSKFATLANITKEVFPRLAEHGFAFTTGSHVEDGLLVLKAKLIHESGESESAEFPITESNPQKVGSAVTYYRRYALAALTGIVADEDDDGNAASAQVTAPTSRKIDQAKQAKSKPATGDGSDIKDKILKEIIQNEADERTGEDVNALWSKIAVDEHKLSNPNDRSVLPELYERLKAGEVAK